MTDATDGKPEIILTGPHGTVPAAAAAALGPAMTRFVEAMMLAKVASGVEAVAAWMYHNGQMRVVHLGEVGSEGERLAETIGRQMDEHSQAIIENTAIKLTGGKRQ